MKGGSYMIPFITDVMNPVIQHIQSIYPMYSHTHILPITESVALQRLIRVCESISHTTQYGFYRVRSVPYDLWKHIQQGIRNTFEDSTSKRNMYILCLGGNLSFTKGYRTTKEQKKDWKALKGYFQLGSLYFVHTKKQFLLSDYLHDPYFAYELDYDDIDDSSNTLHIRPVQSRLNEANVDFNRYLRVHPVIDCTYLEMSLLSTYNHIIE